MLVHPPIGKRKPIAKPTLEACTTVVAIACCKLWCGRLACTEESKKIVNLGLISLASAS